jgi:hypothetical protein
MLRFEIVALLTELTPLSLPLPPFFPWKYDSQFLSYTLPGILGLFLNAIMVVGLLIMGKRARKKLPTAVMYLFPFGLLYGIIDTLPGIHSRFTIGLSPVSSRNKPDTIILFVLV